MRDTIFALATPAGRAALAVMRCSGPGSESLLRAIAGVVPPPRVATLRRLRAEIGGEVFDQALVLWFEGSASFTGEDAFELHLHGGSATVNAATGALLQLGARLAEPGEFSRRAFEAGKLSLVQAEAIADLVDAETSAQRRQALAQLDGALDGVHARWRAALLRTASLLEAQVDFPDEDLPETIAEVKAVLSGLISEIEDRSGERRGQQVREGFRIALVGEPNAGKSSLFNALVGRDAAIVTATPGTTRDIIEAPIQIGGFKVLLADTAGMREAVDEIEAEGVRRAFAWAASADLRIWVSDGSSGRRRPDAHRLMLGDLLVLSKSDLPTVKRPEFAAFEADALPVSVFTAGGLDLLKARLNSLVIERLSGAEFPAVTCERHRRQLCTTALALRDALDSVLFGPELAAEDVRRATSALRSIVGEVGVEDVLGGVFESFCVGK